MVLAGLTGSAALSVLPASAAAAELGGGAVFGPPTTTNRGVSDQIWFKTPRSRPGRMRVAIEVDNLRCSAPAFGRPANSLITTGVSRFKGVRVARDGTFSAKLALDQNNTATGERSKGSATLKGRLRGASASGTISSSITVTRANGTFEAKCKLSPTRWFAESTMRAGGKRLAKPDGRSYFGVNGTRAVTDKTRFPVIVNLNRARKRGGIVLAYHARCTKGPEPFFEGADYSPVFSVKSGKFTVGQTFNSGNPAGPGFAARITTRYTGAFLPGAAKGTLRVRATLFQDGKEIDRCDTGTVKWTALRH